MAWTSPRRFWAWTELHMRERWLTRRGELGHSDGWPGVEGHYFSKDLLTGPSNTSVIRVISTASGVREIWITSSRLQFIFGESISQRGDTDLLESGLCGRCVHCGRMKGLNWQVPNSLDQVNLATEGRFRGVRSITHKGAGYHRVAAPVAQLL